LIWCTMDPQINPEARINHANAEYLVLAYELWRGCGAQTDLWVRCEAVVCRAATGSLSRKTGGPRGPVTVRWHAAWHAVPPSLLTVRILGERRNDRGACVHT